MGRQDLETKKMLSCISVFLLLLVQCVFAENPSGFEGCCRSVFVEGSLPKSGQYNLLEFRTSGFPKNCKDGCVYTKERRPNDLNDDPSHYCFALNDQYTAQCQDQVGSCQCGVKKSRRIIGGSETEVNEYPWMIVFANKTAEKQGGCGATLISDNWAVTASHCFFDASGKIDKTEEDFSLVISLHDRTTVTDELRQVLAVSEIILHPNYNWDTNDNDIALVKLETRVDLNTYSPACLPQQGQDFTGQRGWVYGWGVTNVGGTAADFPAKLLEIEVPIVSDEICKDEMLGLTTLLPGMLCAGGLANKDACGGDSGGPLTVEMEGKHSLAGVVSFGNGCGTEGLYGVYAEVANYRDWIDSTIDTNGGGKFCD